jgi:hypothetical protein
MPELEVTPKRTLSVWWLVIWRACVGAGVLGAIGGLIAGIVAVAAGHREWGAIGGGVVGYLLSIPWSFVVVGMALRKRYRDFRIALVPTEIP